MESHPHPMTVWELKDDQLVERLKLLVELLELQVVELVMMWPPLVLAMVPKLMEYLRNFLSCEIYAKFRRPRNICKILHL